MISGNNGTGVHVAGAVVSSPAGRNTVRHNRIGTDPAGNAPLPNGGAGLTVSGTDNVVSDNLISGNGAEGVAVDPQIDHDQQHNSFTDNRIGTNAAGTIPLPNASHGVALGGDGNTFGPGNVVAGNGARGIEVTGGANKIAGNLVGTTPAGNVPLPNTGDGVEIGGGSGNTIGGSDPADRNVIAANGYPDATGAVRGVHVGANAQSTAVTGNYVGLAADGHRPLGNKGEGILAEAPGTTIRGNVVSANGGDGVQIAANDNTVTANLIGTDATGTSPRVNDGNGVAVLAGTNNRVGGRSAGDPNVISGNAAAGVRLESASNSVYGNLIGTDAAGTHAIPNQAAGVAITGAQNRIGDDLANAGNVISGNRAQGVWISGAAASSNRVRGNVIRANAGLGIDLQPADGVNPNDDGDADAGANGLQNFPVLSTATSGTSHHATVHGELSSRANQTYTLDFYANASCDPSGYGEGERVIGSASVTTDAAGHAAIDEDVDAAEGELVTATATDAAGNTSEFSHCRAVTAVPTVSGGDATVADDDPTPGSTVPAPQEPQQPAAAASPSRSNSSRRRPPTRRRRT